MFGTFAQLKAAVEDEMALTGDAGLAAAMPRFVAAAEHRMNHGNDVERLRCREMEASANLTVTAGSAPLPTGFLEARRLAWDGSPKSTPVYVSPDMFWTERSLATSGSPTLFTDYGGALYVSPAITGTMLLLYYAKPTPLVADIDTNAVLVSHGGLYLRAVLIEAYGWRRNDDEQARAIRDYRALLGAVNTSTRASRHGGNQLIMRKAGARP